MEKKFKNLALEGSRYESGIGMPLCGLEETLPVALCQ